jgi:hypothetical protein
MRVNSSGNLPTGEIKRKEKLITKIITRNYEEKYDLVYYVAEKCGNYRDTGVSKNITLPYALGFLHFQENV